MLSEERKHHISYVQVKNTSGKPIGWMGPRRMGELLSLLKLDLPEEVHVSLFSEGSGAITREPYLDNCVFSDANENVDPKKLLKLDGCNLSIKFKGKSETTMISEVGSRTYSFLHDLTSHVNIYVGKFNPDVPYQHFCRKRDHVTTKDNPDQVFVTSLVKEEEVKRWENKLSLYLRSMEN